jgi:hypothetical protein
MKITIDPYLSYNLKKSSQYGVTSSASYERIVRTMLAAGELRIGPDEYVSGISISNSGLSFQIEARKPLTPPAGVIESKETK